MICVSRYSLASHVMVRTFHRELHDVANHVNTTPNSLGNNDKHKITIAHKQMHPSMIGRIDMLESSKDVGQTGMLTPWGDFDLSTNIDVNKYPNIKYELFKFISEELPNPAITFDCDNIVDYNRILDRMVAESMVSFEFKIPDGGTNNES